MLVRIVRMHFREDKVEDFKKMFHQTYSRIRNFEGCRFLELYQDEKDATVFFTISKWDHADNLNTYRHSDLFRETWTITKSYFAGPPQAHSLLKNVEDSTNPF